MLDFFLFFVFLQVGGGGRGFFFIIIPGENCTSVFTRNVLIVKNEDNLDSGEIWAC